MILTIDFDIEDITVKGLQVRLSSDGYKGTAAQYLTDQLTNLGQDYIGRCKQKALFDILSAATPEELTAIEGVLTDTVDRVKEEDGKDVVSAKV